MSRIEPYPPANPDAEKAVLGSILIDPDARAVVAAILKPEDFSRQDNRLVYQAIVDLGDTPADAVTVPALLDGRGQLDGLGWGIVNELVDRTPPASTPSTMPASSPSVPAAAAGSPARASSPPPPTATAAGTPPRSPGSSCSRTTAPAAGTGAPFRPPTRPGRRANTWPVASCPSPPWPPSLARPAA